MPKQSLATVLETTRISDNTAIIKLELPSVSAEAAPGQFIHIKCGEGLLLRRPISICDTRDGLLTIVAEARGDGTKWLINRQPGDKLDILGPLGNGFQLSGKHIILVGGGIGVPPMLFAARKAPGRVTAILGFRNCENVLLEDAFKKTCNNVIITTDDGSYGMRGTVTAPLEKLLLTGDFDAVLTCGPKPMLKAVASLAKQHGVPCQVSLEERMGCGIGACLVCACKTQKDGKEHMAHVCKDGPVFSAEEVVWS